MLSNNPADGVRVYFCKRLNDEASPSDATPAGDSTSPTSNRETSSVSTGRLPRNVNFSLRAISAPPPVEKTLLISPQHGQTYPLMFSINPVIGRFTARANDKHFMASIRATACGVVTMMADKRECTGAMCSSRERCSSEVPVKSCQDNVRVKGGNEVMTWWSIDD
jgi:hypothetical protein